MYSQILSDFDYGAINGNNFIKDSEEKNKTNRISKYASMAMIGRAYLFYKDYYNRGEQIDMRYPSIKTYLSKEDVTAYLKDLVSNSGLRLTEQFPNSFASSVAMCRSIYVQAEPGDIATLLGDEEHDPGFGFFDKSEYIFSINYNCETLSESDN